MRKIEEPDIDSHSNVNTCANSYLQWQLEKYCIPWHLGTQLRGLLQTINICTSNGGKDVFACNQRN